MIRDTKKPNRKSTVLAMLGSRIVSATTAAALLGYGALPISARANESVEMTVSKAAGNEQRDREVDQVALSAQDLAINRLQSLLKKYTKTAQEPVFLSKLADIYQQKAAIQFRVAHGSASRSKKSLDLGGHHKTIHQSIASLDRLIAQYPNFEEIPHAYYLRGKDYEDIENKAKAAQNYEHLVKAFPNSEDSTAAYMALAEFAIEANDHPRAISFLKEVEKRPEDPHYPFALYKMAWSYYNLKQIPESLSYAERQIGFYNDRAKRAETHFISESDLALRENTLLDVAVFYFEGYEHKVSAYTIDKALDYFNGLAQSVASANGIKETPFFGKMLLRFAKLLRSHSHEADLMAWKDQVLASQSRYPEALDILILVYEYQLNNRKYAQVVDCAKDMAGLYAMHKAFESFPKAQKQVLDTAEGLQNLIVKNKGATEVATYSRVLAQVYDAFVRMVDETDPRIPRAHYNLAETLFTIKDFVGATEHYRWVVDHGKWDAKPVTTRKVAKSGTPSKSAPVENEIGATVVDASIKAIGSRYETLHAKNLIPKELSPKALPAKDTSEIDPSLAQWVEWLDTHVEHALEGTENFVFESNRALYQQGQVHRAVERMARFSAKHPKSTYAVPQASLVLDTYIATQDWEKTHDTANDFMEVKEWKHGEFAAKLFAVASDAFYKQLEAKFRARDYKATLKGCDAFLKRYAASVRLGDTLALAGSAALENIDRKGAMAYFTRLINEVPKSANIPTALLARASNFEDHYLFRAAAQDYRAYIAKIDADKTLAASEAAKNLDVLRKKTLALTWLSADRGELRAALADKALCTSKLAVECEKFHVLGLIDQMTANTDVAWAEQTTDEAFDKARHDSTGETRGLWAMLALEGAAHLSFRDRNIAVSQAAKGWSTLDPLAQFALIPHLSQSMATVFRLNRFALKDVAPLRAHEKWITRRVEVIREMENAATHVMKMPWARIRAEVLNEVAGVYLDLARGLAALPAPKDLSTSDMQAYEDTIRKLTMPFEEKGQDMRAKAFDIASRFAIEDKSFVAISEPFFAENPSQAKALKVTSRLPAATEKQTEKSTDALDLSFLATIDPAGGWNDMLKHPEREISEELAYENPALYLKSLWARSTQTKQLQQVAFFMQEAQQKALIQAGIMGTVKAVSLATAGARGEAFAELEETRRDLSIDVQNRVTLFLAQFYERSFAREKSQNLLKEIKDLKGTKVTSNP